MNAGAPELVADKEKSDYARPDEKAPERAKKFGSHTVSSIGVVRGALKNWGEELLKFKAFRLRILQEEISP